MMALSKIKKNCSWVAVLRLEGQLYKSRSCGDCSVEQVSVLSHIADSLERS